MKPLDKYNLELLDNVHPRAWKPTERANEPYHLLVIGAGPAGIATASLAASMGARVCLVERQFIGGDSFNTGTLPSKTILTCARRYKKVLSCEAFGVNLNGAKPTVDFGAVMARLRRIRYGLIWKVVVSTILTALYFPELKFHTRTVRARLFRVESTYS